MHEASIAQALIETITAEAKKQKGKPIAAKISCSAFSGVNDEALRFKQRLRIPPKANTDSEGNANGIPGRRRTVFGA